MRNAPFFFLLLGIGCLATAWGCDWRVARPQDILATTIPFDPSTLNALLISDTESASVAQYIYEPLIERDNKTLEFRPRLASRWEISADHLTYTFWLRHDVRWHDGRPLSVDDVIYTFEKIRDPKVDAPRLRNHFRDVVRVERAGENAVRFVYAEPYFKALETLGGAWIIPKHVFDDGSDFNTHRAGRQPVGTGPYRFALWETGRNLKIARFDDYWGRKPRVLGIVFRVVPDPIVAFQLLKKSALDYGRLLPIQWVRQTGRADFSLNFTRHKYYPPNYSFIGWNLRRPFFSDRRVRRALSMLINKSAILEKVLFGQGTVVESHFYRFGDYYDEAIRPYPYDPAGAIGLLDEAGWTDHDGDGIRDRDGVPFRFTLMFAAGNQFARSLSLIMQGEFSEAGIIMDVLQLEGAVIGKALAGRDFDAVVIGWATALEADPYQVWHSSQAGEGSNFVGFADARVDRIVEEARREFDREKRRVLYREFQEIIHEEQPYTFLFTTPSLVAVARRFEDVTDYRLGLDPLEWGVGPWHELYEW